MMFSKSLMVLSEKNQVHYFHLREINQRQRAVAQKTTIKEEYSVIPGVHSNS